MKNKQVDMALIESLLKKISKDKMVPFEKAPKVEVEVEAEDPAEEMDEAEPKDEKDCASTRLKKMKKMME